MLTVDDEVIIADTFSMESLLPSNTADYYRYSGSKTSPICFKTISWIVFKEPLTISAYQVISVQSPTLENESRRVWRCSVTRWLCKSRWRPEHLTLAVTNCSSARESRPGMNMLLWYNIVWYTFTSATSCCTAWVSSSVTKMSYEHRSPTRKKQSKI